jgi:hypothetical protein
MLERIKNGVAILVLFSLVVLSIWKIFVGFTPVTPVSGVVVEKIEVYYNGHRTYFHALQVRTDDELIWITVSKRVYQAVADGICYSFGGPRDGKSYDSMRVCTNE